LSKNSFVTRFVDKIEPTEYDITLEINMYSKAGIRTALNQNKKQLLKKKKLKAKIAYAQKRR